GPWPALVLHRQWACRCWSTTALWASWWFTITGRGRSKGARCTCSSCLPRWLRPLSKRRGSTRRPNGGGRKPRCSASAWRRGCAPSTRAGRSPSPIPRPPSCWVGTRRSCWGGNLSCVCICRVMLGTVCPLEQTLRSASAVRVEDDEFLRRDGRPIPTSYSASAIIINEEPAGMVVAFRDQTHRRQNEQRIRSLNAELEQRVLERTAELEAANGELEAFSYSVSHDLRAPLRSIDGFCQVLIEDYTDRLDASGKDYLQRVRTASQRMAELIDGLLDLSRVTRATMSREPVDLTDLAASVVAELTRAKRDRTVTFEVQEGLQATGDARLLRLLVDNLLNNAWKFTSKHETARIEFGSTTL